MVKGTFNCYYGATGSAKSTFAFKFIITGLQKDGDNGIFCSLVDSADEIKKMGEGYGYNALDLEKKGLSIFVSNPDEEHPDAFIMHLEAEIKRTNAKRLVIDGLSAFEYKYRKDMNIIIKRISSLVRKYQITTIVTIRFPVINGFQPTELSLSALFQNIILLKFVEVSGYMKRVMTILKMYLLSSKKC